MPSLLVAHYVCNHLPRFGLDVESETPNKICIYILRPEWHHVKAESTPISYYVSNITLASEWPQTGGNFEDTNICKLNFGFSRRLSGQFEAIFGG